MPGGIPLATCTLPVGMFYLLSYRARAPATGPGVGIPVERCICITSTMTTNEHDDHQVGARISISRISIPTSLAPPRTHDQTHIHIHACTFHHGATCLRTRGH
jgi:hypothetical protein